MHDEYVINLSFMIFWMLIILIHALKWLLKVFGITKWSWNQSKIAGEQNLCRGAAMRRLTACPKWLAAWSRVGAIFFCFFFFLRYFSALVLYFTQTVNHPSIFTFNFLLFHPFLCPNQPLKLIPMHFIFINTSPSSFLHLFFIISLPSHSRMNSAPPFSFSNLFISHSFSC